MGMSKTIIIDGIAVPFKASAAIPRLYRLQFGVICFMIFLICKNRLTRKKKRTVKRPD